MRPIVALCLWISVGLVTASCSVNILEPFGDKFTDDVLYEKARIAINKGDYTEALTLIGDMTAGYRAKTEVVVLHASAYVGRCGYEFLPTVTALGNLGTTRLFPLLLNTFVGGTGQRIDDCRSAEDLIESLGSVSTRTADQNLFLAMISLAKMGAILSFYNDLNQDGSGNTVRSFCDDDDAYLGARPGAAVDDGITQSDLREMGTGMTLLLENLGALAAQVSLGGSALTSLTNICSQVQGLDPTYNFCTITNPASFTANHLAGFLSLLQEGASLGFNAPGCGGLDVTNAGCRCF